MNLPDRVVLEKLLRGQLAPEVAEQLCRQLENERTFASVADEVMAADTFVDALKATSISTDPVPSLQLQSLIERFQSWDSSGVASGTVAAMSPTDPAVVMPNGPGEPTQIGHFRVISKLGQGGMGAVYLGQDLQLNRRAALKVMRPEVASHPEARERFLREARAAAAIEHDNIVAIWQVGEDNGSPFIAMPLLLGESLEDRLKREPKSGVDAILKLARETAQGLAAAHDAGLIHRDIKPANLWIEGDPTSPEAAKAFRRVKILDFGLARASEDVLLTSPGAILGTPAFMSPEQGRGLPVDGRSDLFSLGVVLYRMATGTQPFKGDTMMALLTSLAVDTPAPPTLKNEQIPAVLSDLILRLLQKEPADRFQSASEVVAAVQDVTRQLATRTAAISSPKLPILPELEPVPVAVAEPARPPMPPKSRQGLWLGVGGAALVLLMGVIVIAITDRDGKVVAKIEVDVPKDGKVQIVLEKAEVMKGKIAEKLSDKVASKTEAGPTAKRPPVSDGFLPLFDGKDLNGWTGLNGMTDAWTIENGILTGRGNWSGHLFTEKSYGDVHLRVEARVNRGGNSGIFTHAPLTRGWPYGYEAQINSTRNDVKTGGLYYRGLRSVPSGVEPPEPDEWFTLELVVRKNVVTVFVDGKKSAEFVDPNPEKQGRIALQKHDPQTVIEFRKVEIKDLSAPPAKSKE